MRPLSLIQARDEKVSVCSLLLAIPVRAQEEPKLAHLFVYRDSVSAEGVWRPDNLSEKTELAFDAVTRVECYKHGGSDLVNAEAYRVQMTASVVFGMPSIDVAYFPVVTWDTDKIIAADSSSAPMPVCTWTQITISLQDHSIMATDTRKLGEGHDGFNNVCKAAPLAQTYHLVEETQELARRKLRAAKLARQHGTE